jgi:tetratricopeptide (TPR) repeat protein
MDRLQENLKRTLQVASVIGRDFAFRILQMITGMQEELKSHLLNLQGLEFIYEKALFPELEYIFKHGLTQEVAYNSLLLKRRKEIHERIGQAIEQLYSERVEEFYEVLGYHHSRAEDLPKACHYLELSGQKAMRHFATQEAFGFYREALELLTKQPDTEENRKERVEVILLMFHPMRILGYPEGSLELLREGERLSQLMGDERSLATFHSRMGHYFLIREGNTLAAIEYAKMCWQEAQEAEDLELTATAGVDLCVAYRIAGKHAEIVDLAPRILALLEEAGKEREVFGAGVNAYSLTLLYYGHSMGYLGDFQTGKALLDKAVSFALQMNDRASLGPIELHYGFQLADKGDGPGAAEHFQNALRFLEEVKFLPLVGLAWTGLGRAYHLMGEVETAREYMEKGLKTRWNAGFPFLLSVHFFHLGWLHGDLGDLRAAQEHLAQALRLSQQHHEESMEAVSRIWLGRTLARADPSEAQQAEGHIRQGIQMAEELKLKATASHGYHFLGEFHAARGEREKALENLKRAASIYQEMGMEYWLRQAQAALRRVEEKEEA